MQLANSEFLYDYKEGKPSIIWKQGERFAVIYCQHESTVQAIAQFLNDLHAKAIEQSQAYEQQAANKLHNDKIVNPRTGEKY